MIAESTLSRLSGRTRRRSLAPARHLAQYLVLRLSPSLRTLPSLMPRATQVFQRFFSKPSAFLAPSPVMPGWLRR
jgi:hypothetical protein